MRACTRRNSAADGLRAMLCVLGSVTSRPSPPAPADISDPQTGAGPKNSQQTPKKLQVRWSVRDPFQDAPKRLTVPMEIPDRLVVLQTLGAQRRMIELLDLV